MASRIFDSLRQILDSTVIMNQFRQKVVYLPLQYNFKSDFMQFLYHFSDGYNHWLKLTPSDKKKVDKVTERVYNYITTIDDVFDNAKIRKGKPTPAALYGHAFTTGASTTYLLEEIGNSAEVHPEAPKVIAEGMAVCLEGTAGEMYYRDTGICPSLEMYKQFIIAKTGGIIHFQCKLNQLLSDNKTDYTTISHGLGLYHQMWNDYVALLDSKYTESKGTLSDITEGKFTMPFIHAINEEGLDPKVINMMRMRTKDEDLKQFVRSIMLKHKSLEYTKNEISEAGRDLIKNIKIYGGNPIFEALPQLE